MCNLSDSVFCLPFIYTNPVQHFTLSNEAETQKEKLCLSKHFCLGCFFFVFQVLYLNKYPIMVFIGTA